MLAVSADRRFSLLLLCTLAAFVALAFATDRSPAASVSASSAARSAPAALRPTAPLDPPLLLQPLLAMSPADRFPGMTFTLTTKRSLLPDSQIVSYYGNPGSALMGILGSDDLESIASQLERQATRYDRLNGDTDVIPAIHLVYAVAQPWPTENGLYLQYVDDKTVRRYVNLVEERDMLLFLDLQIGHSTVGAELEKVLPYLRNPRVHLAIDPEFAMSSGQIPGEHLGSLRAAEIDRAQAMLQELVLIERLPPKLLIVHQFLDSMLPDGEAIQRYPDVELIIDMDGFGPAAVKQTTYEGFAVRPYATHAAIKLFLQHDPDLMSEEEVLVLEPRPAVVIYQ